MTNPAGLNELNLHTNNSLGVLGAHLVCLPKSHFLCPCSGWGFGQMRGSWDHPAVHTQTESSAYFILSTVYRTVKAIFTMLNFQSARSKSAHALQYKIKYLQFKEVNTSGLFRWGKKLADVGYNRV